MEGNGSLIIFTKTGVVRRGGWWLISMRVGLLLIDDNAFAHWRAFELEL